MSEAKVRIGGQITGTAWLVHPQHAITAAHCVDACGTAVELLFLNPNTGAHDVLVVATVLLREAGLDGALLQLAAPLTEISVLPAIQLPADFRSDWQAKGFPAIAENNVEIFEANGSIGVTTALAQKGNPQVIQLNLANAAFAPEKRIDEMTGNEVHALAGLSGSAVRISGGSRDGYVIGIIRCSILAMPQDIIYATPIEALWERFEPHLHDVTLNNWIRTAGMIRRGTVPGSLMSNIDEDLISAAWHENVVEDITVDLPWDAACPLIPAILRIVLHQPGIARLHVRNPVAWNQRLLRYADAWIALASFSPDEITNPFVECSQESADSGTSYPTNAAVAEAIHASCDQFVLDHLNNRLSVMFEEVQPKNTAGFHIADDLIQHMSATWGTWLTTFRADPVLLHHYFALMLTQQGTHDSIAEPSPGAGPLTMNECILPATIFGLAIASLLPNALSPKRQQPGNLGRAQATGHSCGILAVKRQRLASELRSHQWSTQVVLLQHLQYLPAEWRAATATLLSDGSSPRPTLNRPAPSSLIITSDEATIQAIETGVHALKTHLASLQIAQIRMEEEYATSAAPPL